MNQDEKKTFFRFLHSATTGEIERKLMGLLYVTAKLKDSDAIGDAEWMVRQINIELDARKQAGL